MPAHTDPQNGPGPERASAPGAEKLEGGVSRR